MDENTNKDLRRILSLYREYELRDNAQATHDTIWVPTPIIILLGEIELIDSWYSKERKSHEGKALIPGAGDGRRGACLARMGYDVLGIEERAEPIAIYHSLIERIANEGLIDRERIKMIGGDFTEDSAYQSAGTRFEDYSKIFARLSREDLEKLALKIRAQSPYGAELFVLQPADVVHPILGLELINAAKISHERVSVPFELRRYIKN